jgi:aminocarboxymuconate-semialdehyde decarboxylase
MDHGCSIFPKDCKSPVLKKQPSEYLRQLYFDSLVFTAEGLRHLAAECGPSQIVIGTDYAIPWVKNPVDHVLSTPGLSDADRIAILGGTAAKLLKIPA